MPPLSWLLVCSAAIAVCQGSNFRNEDAVVPELTQIQARLRAWREFEGTGPRKDPSSLENEVRAKRISKIDLSVRVPSLERARAQAKATGVHTNDVIRAAAAPELTHHKLKFRTWRVAAAWPEASVAAVRLRNSVGIALSGGGSRAYSASVGLVRGLDSLGLMQKAAYLSSISGGTWFAATYTYHQTSATDQELLGASVKPSSLSTSALSNQADYLMAAPPQTLSLEVIASYLLQPVFARVKKYNLAWIYAVQEKYLEPFGLRDQHFTWTEDDISRIRATNPSLKNAKILCAKPGRPYLIMGSTLQGPLTTAPYPKESQHYNLYEMGGLATGVSVRSEAVEYKGLTTKYSMWVGGYTENVAVGALMGTKQGRAEAGSYSMSISWAVGTSSCYIGQMSGTLIASYPSVAYLFRKLGRGLKELNPLMPYSSPTAPNPSSTMSIFMDGGNVENTGIMPLVVRGVKTIVSLISTSVPLATKEEYDAKDASATQANNFNYDPKWLSDCVSSLFGVAGHEITMNSNYQHNQVFEKSSFQRLVHGLQQAQSQGKFPVTALTLTTVDNSRYGVKAGAKIELIFFYLSKATEFEDLLPTDTQQSIQQGRSVECKEYHHSFYLFAMRKCWFKSSQECYEKACGMYELFPNYSTSKQLRLTKHQTKLLAAFVQWGVDTNKELLEKSF